MKKDKPRQAKRRKPVKADKKTAPKKAEPKERKAEFQPPDHILATDDQEAVFVVGAMIDHVYVDVRMPDMVEVMAASLGSEVLDASGESRLDYYRFLVPSDNDVIMAFFEGKQITKTGAYKQPRFQASLAFEGTLWGTDTNPNDVSRPIKVLRETKFTYLAEVMADLADEGEGLVQDTEGLKNLRTKVELRSQLNAGHVHEVGSKAVLVDTTAEDGSMLMIEVQAKGWQECFEISSDQVEPWVDLEIP